MSPAVYDAAGNLTNWGGFAYSWNRLNQMLTTTGTGINRSYGYTADGERILERNALDDTRTLWIRDLSGRVLREYGRTGGGTWSWSKDYVHRDGAVISTVTPSGTRHLHLDHLGSVRGASDTQVPPQPILSTVRDFYPFGLDALAGTDAERMRFAGHERDTRATLSQTDDLDYMHARYYSPVVGRFLSIDPGRDWNAREPQSWNLFSYVRNNPVRFIDPFGLKTENGSVVAEAEVVARDPAEEQRLNLIGSMQLALRLRALLMKAERDEAAQLRSPGVLPHGIGLVAGGGVEAGMGPRALALAAQAYSGGGIFWGDGLSAGGFTQSGAFGGLTNPEQFAYLASAGVGLGAFTTNATYPRQLLGPFDTWQLTLPIYTIQYSRASPIWFFGVTRAVGKSYGLSISRYPVTTTAASGRAGR